MVKAQTLKGFRDFLPQQARKRQYVVDTLKEVFESYGFEPLETPALEYEEVLLGKYGEEGDKMMYRFKDLGKRKVALRYDQTVPLARVVAQYGPPAGGLPIPFKRYQIQPVWRAENTQKGRFREFLQCDADVVGTKSVLSDAEVVATAAQCLESLGFKKYKILINDRNIFNDVGKMLRVKFPNLLKKQINLFLTIATAVDKIKKIYDKGVIEELARKGLSKDEAKACLDIVANKEPTSKVKEILDLLKNSGLELKTEFSPTLARGLDYYTGMIFEIEIGGYSAGSVCGGGRYDNLIGMFSGKDTPAVGFAFGFDRLMEAMDELGLFPDDLVSTKILVTIFSPELQAKSIKIASELRSSGVNVELYLDENAPLDKQLKYADKKGIPYAVIIGPDEVKNNTVTLKNLKTGDQKTVPQSEILDAVE